MDRIAKFLNKLNQKERNIVKDILEKIKKGEIENLDIKKLKDESNYFRARKGNIRIIYKINEGGETILLSIERRSDNTYNFL
jgi:mRNA-degrading endonuclease RelE of RelBE toxin-antitoxin system